MPEKEIEEISVSDQIRAFAAKLAEEMPEVQKANMGTNHDVTVLLLRAYFDAVRAEWQGWFDADPVLKADIVVARQLMADAGYDGMDPICGVPGTKPMIAKVDNLEAVSFEHSMHGAMPLSAIFLNRVREVREATAKVEAARLAAAASTSEPQAPPQK